MVVITSQILLQSIIDEDVDTRIQILQHDKEEAIQMYVDATDQLNKLREEFHSAETLRDKVSQ